MTEKPKNIEDLIPPDEFLDINVPNDYLLAEAIMKNQAWSEFVKLHQDSSCKS